MHLIDAKLCSHLMFQNSFRNTERQNNYRNFYMIGLNFGPVYNFDVRFVEICLVFLIV